MRNEEKSTKRLWRRGNVLDIAIVLLLVAAMVTVGYRYYKNREDVVGAQMQTVMLTFRAEDISAAIPTLIPLGETVYLNSTNEALGEVALHPHATNDTPFSVTAARDVVNGGQGDLVDVELPDVGLRNMEGMIRCQGSMDGTTFLWNGKTPITQGQVLVVHTEHTTLSITIVEIKAQDK